MSQEVRTAATPHFRRIGFGAAALGTLMAMTIGPTASADTIDVDGFESYTLGQPLGQNGWTANDIGVYNASGFDIAIADPSSIWTGGELGTRALRMSNAVSSLSFGNQLQTPSLANEVGETVAMNDGYSGGTRQSRLTGSFDFASATRTYQPGLAITFSPDRGDGARMSFFRISDQLDGLRVEVVYSGPTAVAPFYTFYQETLATGLSRDEVHTLEFTFDLVDGPDNDVLWARIGGACSSWAESGSWETYHRLTTEGGPPHGTKTVDSLLFRISAVAVPALSGGGFFIDNMSLESSTVPAMPPLGTPVAPTAPTGTMVLGGNTTITGSPVVTNACAPVTGYTATITPLSGGAPVTFTSPTPSFTFPTPFSGAFTATISASSVLGAGPESERVTFTFPPVFAGDDDLAFTGAQTLPLGVTAASMIVLGAAALWFSRRPQAAPVRANRGKRRR